MDGNCNECRKRNWCQKLCPEAIAYAEQDEVTQKELTVGIPQYAVPKKKTREYEPTKYAKNFIHILDPVEEKEEVNKTRENREEFQTEFSLKERAAIGLFGLGWSREKIAKVLRISRNSVTKALKSSALIN